VVTTQQPIRAIIVDDEGPARQHIRALLQAHADVVVVGECATGLEAVGALAATAVDLAFLDVQMPELDGFGVVAEIGPERMPAVIFTSAYSEFAVRAFEAYALDYLLKPFDDARFAAALERARQQIRAERGVTINGAHPTSEAATSGAADARLTGLVEHVRRPQQARYPEALAIKSGAHYVVVRMADVDWIEADGNYARLYAQKRPRLLTKSLATLEKDVLDPEVFVRVHRSAIVNSTKIAAVEPHFHGELTLVLHDGTRVQCSRRFRKRLEEKLYFTT
jgi:two-component system, LytTR family, response regulator